MEDQAEGLRRLVNATAGKVRQGVCVFCGKLTPARVDDLSVCLGCANWIEHFRKPDGPR